MDYLNGQTNSDKSMATAFKNFQNMFTKIELSKLKSGNWCFNDIGYETTSSSLSILNETQKLDYIIKGNKMFFYDSYSRLALTNEFLRQSTLKCNGIIMKDWNDTDKTPMYVGTLTADEIVYAGGEISNLINNDNFYLINENYKNGSLGYSSFWTLSPSINYLGSDNISALDSSGNMNSMDRVSYDHYAFRPAVSLIPGIEIESGGTGTKANPYVIK